jgi:hypothetical protein
MRNRFVLFAAAAAVVACDPLVDAAHNPVTLQAPYNGLPADEPIESGKPVILTARQQEAVVAGVTKWMKDPTSVQFGDIRSVLTPRGQLAVCGQVSGRNSGGRIVGLTPFIGVLKEAGQTQDFIVAGIATSNRERTEVMSLCRQSGVVQD